MANFSSFVSFVLALCIVHIKKKQKSAEEGKWKNGNRKQQKNGAKNLNAKGSEAVPVYVYLRRLWKHCRLFSFLVACQAWPPVSHAGSQMTALILLGSAPNQHFAH